MTRDELRAILSRMYHEAPPRQKVVQIHLFGIRHAKDIADAGSTARDVTENSTIPDSYAPEVQKGMTLARHVVERG